MTIRIAAIGLLAASLVALPGCGGGGEDRLPVFPAEGTVKTLGKPAARAVIVFHPVAVQGALKGPPIATEADDDGKFRLSTYLADDGAPEGEYIVTVQPGGTPSLEDSDGTPRRAEPAEELKKYAYQSTSPFKATVKSGENRFEFELK